MEHEPESNCRVSTLFDKSFKTFSLMDNFTNWINQDTTIFNRFFTLKQADDIEDILLFVKPVIINMCKIASRPDFMLEMIPGNVQNMIYI